MTFIAAFSTRDAARAAATVVGDSCRAGGRAARLSALARGGALSDLPITFAHLTAFTVLAMLCHTRLAESRPDPAHLTGVLRVRLAGRRAGRRGSGARRAGRVFVDPRVPTRDRRGPSSPSSERAGGSHGEVARLDAGRGARSRSMLFVAGYWASPSSTSARASSSRTLDRRDRIRDPGGPAVAHAPVGAAIRRHGRRPARRRGRHQNRRRSARTASARFSACTK